MKEKLLNTLSNGERMVSEDCNVTNKDLVVNILTLFNFLDQVYLDKKVTLIYYGNNPISFLFLFILAYIVGYKVMKVKSEYIASSQIFRHDHPVVFADTKENLNEIRRLAMYKSLNVFHIHNVSFRLVMTYLGNNSALRQEISRKHKEYSKNEHSMLLGVLKANIGNPLFVEDSFVLEMPTSGINRPVKYVGFTRHNIESIVKIISKLPKLLAHNAIRIFSTIDSSFFYMLSVYVNQKTLLTGITQRNNLSVQLFTKTQAVVLEAPQVMYLWNVVLKDYIFNSKYRFFNEWPFKWILAWKIRNILRQFFGQSLKSLYIINAGLPSKVKEMLRKSRLNVVFLYGIRETGNILGSNIKKDKLSLDSYKIEKGGTNLKLVEDDITGVLYVSGDSVSDSIRRSYISNSEKENDLFVNTHDVGTIDKGILYFISPVGAAISRNDRLNFNLYFAERSLQLLPEVAHAISFDYKEEWYIGVQLDESYLGKTNINLQDIQRKLDGIKRKMNAYLPNSNQICGIEITTQKLLLNDEGKLVRFIHKLKEDV